MKNDPVDPYDSSVLSAMTTFFQDGPTLAHPYDADPLLPALVARHFTGDERRYVEDDLRSFGDLVLTDLERHRQDAEANEPVLRSHNPWGRRVDEIIMSHGWTALEHVAAREGLVAIGYERRHGPRSRIHQFAKLYLFHPSSAIVTCPLAMTDGAARLLEVHGDAVLRREMFGRLTSRDPDQFWTSGQWMTERTGGSDVGGTSTVARPIDPAGWYALTGEKWFTSATTSQMALTLARIAGAPAGSRGLSLFCLTTRLEDGSYNGITIQRLKDKLGTRAMPTAELRLDGTRARLVGVAGQGVKNITTMMNITRVYNAVCAAASLRRGLSLARDYARRRTAFGRRLIEQPLHAETLAQLEVDAAALFVLVFHVVELMGQEECGELSEDEAAILRLLIPLVKLYTAKICMPAVSELLECFGGAGYIEDTGLPRLLRDAQVLPIWEGTTNILSLDALRAMATAGSLEPFVVATRGRLQAATAPLGALAQSLMDRLERLAARLACQDVDPDLRQAEARNSALLLAHLYTAGLLADEARAGGAWAILARRHCERPMPAAQLDATRLAENAQLLFERHEQR